MERYVPEAVLTLTFHKRGTHVLKVFLILFAVGVIGRNLVEHSHESGHYPAVAARPVAVFAVGLLVGGHKVGVAPPQAIFLVVKTAGEGVAGPGIHLVGFLSISGVASSGREFGEDRHAHLYGVNPCPVVNLRSVDEHVHCRLGLGEHFGTRGETIEVDVDLCGAIIVGIAGGGVITTHAPLEAVGPRVGIIVISVVGIYGMQGHQSLEIYRTGPDVGFIDLFTRVIGNAKQWVGVFFQIMVIDFDKGVENLGTRLELLGHHGHRGQKGHRSD